MEPLQQLVLPISMDEVRRWRERYPLEGRGIRVSRFLAAYLHAPFVLMPPPEDLTRRVSEAIFWECMVRPTIVRAPFELDIRVALHDALGRAFGLRIGAFMNLKEQRSFRAWIWDSIRPEIGAAPLMNFWTDIRSSLFYPCALIAHGLDREAEAFVPLLNLWASGWFPRGTLIDQSMGILVAAEADPIA